LIFRYMCGGASKRVVVPIGPHNAWHVRAIDAKPKTENAADDGTCRERTNCMLKKEQKRTASQLLPTTTRIVLKASISSLSNPSQPNPNPPRPRSTSTASGHHVGARGQRRQRQRGRRVPPPPPWAANAGLLPLHLGVGVLQLHPRPRAGAARPHPFVLR
jgi:hypothetical protein